MFCFEKKSRRRTILIDSEGADFPRVDPRMRTKFDDEDDAVACTSTVEKMEMLVVIYK